MDKKAAIDLRWAWVAVGLWGLWFGFHLVRTYSLRELAILVPLGVSLAAAAMLIFRKGRIWLRILLVVAAAALWLVMGRDAIEARRAAYRLRHFSPDAIEQIIVYRLITGTEERDFPPLLVLLDHDKIKTVIQTFSSVRPCFSDTTRAEEHYQLVLLARSGEERDEIRVPLFPHPLAKPPTMGLVLQWVNAKDELQSEQYQSAQLYRQLKEFGLR